MSRRVQIGKQRGIIGSLVSLVMQVLLAIFCILVAATTTWALCGGKPTLLGAPLFSASDRHHYYSFIFGTLAEWAIVIIFVRAIFKWLRTPVCVDIADDGSWSLRNPLGAVICRIPANAPRQVDMNHRSLWGNAGMDWTLVIETAGRKYESFGDWSDDVIGAAYKALLPDPTN